MLRKLCLSVWQRWSFLVELEGRRLEVRLRVPPVTASMATYLMHDHSKDRGVICLMHTLPGSIEFACDSSGQLRVGVTPVTGASLVAS
jgi:hypothetical protein